MILSPEPRIGSDWLVKHDFSGVRVDPRTDATAVTAVDAAVHGIQLVIQQHASIRSEV
jgi:hypothetical protein